MQTRSSILISFQALFISTFLLSAHGETTLKSCDDLLRAAEFSGALEMFVRRPLIVSARQARVSGYVKERGALLFFKPGDWLVKESSRQIHVMSNEEFVEGYESLTKKIIPHGQQRYTKKSLVISAFQVKENAYIEERGALLSIFPGDWVVLIKGRLPYVLTNDDFERVYDRLF